MTLDPQIVSPPARPEASPEHASDTAAARYASSLVLSELAREGVDVGSSLDALRGQRARALAALRASPEGAALASAIAAGVERAEPLISAARSAAVETRASAIAAATMLVAWLGEHRGLGESPSALAHLVSAARMGAAEARIHDDALARGLVGAELAEALKLADRCGVSRRQDFASALALHREVQASKPKPAAFAWPTVPIAHPDPFPAVRSRARVDEADDEDERPEGPAREPDAADAPEPVETGRPNPGVGEDEAKAIFGIVDGWGTARPSGVELGGRHGRAPAFALPAINASTGRAMPTRAPGPTKEAVAHMTGKGWSWDPATSKWIAKGDE